ncbi:flavodoxin family protein [Candidatus Dojkabacteria bacterium]|nr:flavodoxin family protein [Candidatus Dojkabacteria bacterium]
MKSLVVYDSVYGNTRKIAEAIKEGLSEKYETKIIQASEAKAEDTGNIDLLVVGSPTHGGWFTEDVKGFLNSIPEELLKNTAVASFDTSMPQEGQSFFVKLITRIFGNAAPRILKVLGKEGAKIIDSEIFWVLGKEGPLKEGEEERAKQWAESLSNKKV